MFNRYLIKYNNQIRQEILGKRNTSEKSDALEKIMRKNGNIDNTCLSNLVFYCLNRSPPDS